MTSLLFLISLVAGWVFYSSGQYWVIDGELSVYRAMYVATLASAVVLSLVNLNARLTALTGVILFTFWLNINAYGSDDPEISVAINHMVPAIYCIVSIMAPDQI